MSNKRFETFVGRFAPRRYVEDAIQQAHANAIELFGERYPHIFSNGTPEEKAELRKAVERARYEVYGRERKRPLVMSLDDTSEAAKNAGMPVDEVDLAIDLRAVLDPKEQQVCFKLMSGWTQREIADALEIDPRRVSEIKKRIKPKLTSILTGWLDKRNDNRKR